MPQRTSSRCFLQVYVHGDSLETCCVAIVVPDPDVVRELAEQRGIEEKSWEGICANKEIQQFILKEMLAKGNEHKLNKLEQVSTLLISALQSCEQILQFRLFCLPFWNWRLSKSHFQFWHQLCLVLALIGANFLISNLN